MAKTDPDKDVFGFGGAAVTKKFQELVLQKYPQLSTKDLDYFESLKLSAASLHKDEIEGKMRLAPNLYGDITEEYKLANDLLLHPNKHGLSTLSLAEHIAEKARAYESGDKIDIIFSGGPATSLTKSDLDLIQQEIGAAGSRKKSTLVNPPVSLISILNNN